MNRDEFVRQVVADTIAHYLRTYCAPWTIAQAQAKCKADAERLADATFGTVDMPTEPGPLALPAPAPLRALPGGRASGALARRFRLR